jgi:hypothetical protein
MERRPSGCEHGAVSSIGAGYPAIEARYGDR